VAKLTFQLHVRKTADLDKATLLCTCQVNAEQLRLPFDQELHLDFENKHNKVFPTRAKHIFLRVSIASSLSSLSASEQPSAAHADAPGHIITRQPDNVTPDYEAAQPTAQGAPPHAGELLDQKHELLGATAAILAGEQKTTDIINTVVRSYDTWGPFLLQVKWVVDAVGKFAQIHPYASAAWTILSSIPKVIIQQVERDQKIKMLLGVLKQALEVVKEAEDLEERCHDKVQAEIISRMLQQAGECGHLIQSYAKDTGFWERLAKNVVRNADKFIEECCSSLRELQKAFIDRTTIITRVSVLRVADDLGDLTHQMKDLDADTQLKDLPYGEGAHFDRERPYLKGTRVLFLDAISEWANNPVSPRMFVLFGQAGSGKSAIAHEIARRFEDMSRLTSSFIFDRSFPLPPHFLITSLVRDLCDNNPSFKKAVVEAIRGDSSLRLGTRNCRTLFVRLLTDQLRGLHFVGPTLVIIDALDECGAAAQRASLVTTLSGCISDLPDNFRILITSRPEKDIQDAFEGKKSIQVLRMDDRDLSADTKADISRYIRRKLPSKLSDNDCGRIADAAGSLFQWAAVACEFISKPPPGLTTENSFNILLNNPKHDVQIKLDELYSTVLSALSPKFELYEEISHQFRVVVGMLLTSFEPLSQESLAALGRFTPGLKGDVEAIIRSVVESMGALLSNVSPTTRSCPMVPLHTLFRDFLTSRERGGIFYIDVSLSHVQLAHACLGLMHHLLKFNICGLETSYRRNEDVHDLALRIERHIPFHLSYACRL